MSLKKSLLIIISSLTIAFSVHAVPHKPSKCPSAEAIKANGLIMAIPIDRHKYIASQLNTYDTEHEWAFVIGVIDADNEEAALTSSRTLLKKLSGNPRPELIKGAWSCLYDQIDNRYFGFAIAGPDLPTPSAMRALLPY